MLRNHQALIYACKISLVYSIGGPTLLLKFLLIFFEKFAYQMPFFVPLFIFQPFRHIMMFSICCVYWANFSIHNKLSTFQQFLINLNSTGHFTTLFYNQILVGHIYVQLVGLSKKIKKKRKRKENKHGQEEEEHEKVQCFSSFYLIRLYSYLWLHPINYIFF